MDIPKGQDSFLVFIAGEMFPVISDENRNARQAVSGIWRDKYKVPVPIDHIFEFTNAIKYPKSLYNTQELIEFLVSTYHRKDSRGRKLADGLLSDKDEKSKRKGVSIQEGDPA